MEIANCNGVDLAYEVHGEGEPLICVMGITADRTMWMLNVGAFAEHHRVITFDNRDVGQSEYVTDQYEIADMARDTLALADHLGIDSFHLLGLSMGGAISQEIALMAPERLKTLTLAVTWGGGGKWWRARGRGLWLGTPQMSAEELGDLLLMLNLSEALFENEEVMERARERVRNAPHPQKPDGFYRQQVACNHFDLRDRLPEITVPTQVIGAERDVMIPVFKAREIAELIPGAKLTIVDGAAHGMNMERAVEFNELVLDFTSADRSA